jgi:hypothetical protein
MAEPKQVAAAGVAEALAVVEEVAAVDADAEAHEPEILMNTRLLSIGLFSLLLASVCALSSGCQSKSQQLTFDSPEAAAEALHDACRHRDRAALERIFGPDMEQLASGNKRQDQADFQRFAAAFDRKWALDKEADGRIYLAVGEQGWEFPAPIVPENGRWKFDTQQGIDDMDDRRIGLNELSAIRTCDAYVRAQNEYFAMDPDGDAVKAYAQKIRSSPGRRDGLWWPDDDDPTAPVSPLGPGVAAAVQRGDLNPMQQTGRQPYRGYYFKPLVRQSGSANGGAREYIDATGRMTNGFALVAWPAKYDKTGVMSFIVSQDGNVFQRDLGQQTPMIAEQMTAFDPSGWVALTP